MRKSRADRIDSCCDFELPADPERLRVQRGGAHDRDDSGCPRNQGFSGHPQTWEAYDYYLRGTEIYWHGLAERTIDYVYEARRLLEKSMSIDPRYVRAYAVLARTYVHTYLEPRDHDYLSPAGLDRARALAQARAQLGWCRAWMAATSPPNDCAEVR